MCVTEIGSNPYVQSYFLPSKMHFIHNQAEEIYRRDLCGEDLKNSKSDLRKTLRKIP